MTSPHVLFVAPSAYTLGGLATWMDYLLPGLAARGWRATLGLVVGARHHRPEAYLREHSWDGTIAIPCRTGTERGRRNAVRRVVQQLEPDVVCSVNIPDAISAVAELRAEGRASARAVMACHGIQGDLFEDMRWLRSSMDAVVCVNRLACRLAEQAIADDTVAVEYAACGTLLQDRTRRCEPDVPLTIACVGRFEEGQKRISDVVRIMRRLAEDGTAFRLIVAGGGPEERSLRSALEECLPDERLQWLGQLPASQLSERVYEQADVLLLTSLWETGPIVAWEAMAHGTVVVSTRYVGAGREGALRHRENALLFEIGDVEAAVEALRELSEDHGLWWRLSRAGQQTIEERYSIEHSVTSWEAALKSVCSRRPRELTPPALRPGRGRLADAVGPVWGERLRTLGRRLPPDSGPGGEWPHTLAGGGDSEGFWRDAADMDRAEAEPALPVETEAADGTRSVPATLPATIGASAVR